MVITSSVQSSAVWLLPGSCHDSQFAHQNVAQQQAALETDSHKEESRPLPTENDVNQ